MAAPIAINAITASSAVATLRGPTASSTGGQHSSPTSDLAHPHPPHLPFPATIFACPLPNKAPALDRRHKLSICPLPTVPSGQDRKTRTIAGWSCRANAPVCLQDVCPLPICEPDPEARDHPNTSRPRAPFPALGTTS